MTLAEIRAQLELDHPVLTEQVNGSTQTLTSEQRSATLDRWAQAAFEIQQEEARSDKNAETQATVDAGYTVQPEGFTLALGDSDRSQFTQMLTLVQEALSLGLIDNDTPQTIADKDGGKHTVSTLRLRQILVLYGLHYKGIWDAATAP